MAGTERLKALCKDFKECRIRRKRKADEPLAPEARAVETLLQTPFDLDFTNTPFKDVMGYFREAFKLNIVVDGKSMKDAKPVTLRVKQLPVETALRLVLAPAGLSYTVEDAVIVIAKQEKLVEPTEGKK